MPKFHLAGASLLTAFSLPQLKSSLVFPAWLPLPVSLCVLFVLASGLGLQAPALVSNLQCQRQEKVSER